MVNRPYLAGRGDELEFLMGRLSQIFSGEGDCILLSGAAGMGKTRLAEEFEALAAQAGCLVLVGRCLPGAPSMFLPFMEAMGAAREVLLHRADGSREGAIKGRILDLAEESGSLFADCLTGDPSKKVENSNVYFRVLSFLKLLSEMQPVVLRLDDLQWSDSNSVLLLHFLARNLRDSRVLLLGTYRPEDLVGQPEEPAHPLSVAIEEMTKERIAIEVSLKPLQRAEIGQEINSALRGETEGDLVRLVWQESEGNPLYALEIVRMLYDEEQIIKQGEVWKVMEDLKPRIPSTVREVMLRRIERLSARERRLVEHAAILGYDFDPQVLAELLHDPFGQTVSSLRELGHGHQLLAERQGRFAFEHDKIRQTVYERMTKARRAAIHAMVGEMLEARGPQEELSGELAYHFYHAGENAKCVKYALRAGECCARRYATREARPYFQMAMERLREPGEDEEIRRRAYEGMGDVSFELRNYEGALKHYEECIPLAASGKDRARLLRKIGECWWPTRLGKGSMDTMLSYFDRAEACECIEPFDRSEILSNRSVFAAWGGDLHVAVEYCERAEQLLRGIDYPERLGLELINHLQLLLSMGAMDKAREVVSSLTDIFSQHPSPRGELGAENAIGYYFMHRGEQNAAAQHFARSLEVSEALGDYVEVCWTHAFASLGYEGLGRYQEALDEAALAMRAAEDSGSPYMRSVAGSTLAVCNLRLDRFSAAQRHGDDLSASINEEQWKVKTLMHGLVNFALAELSSVNEEWSRADLHYRNSLEVFRGGPFETYFEAMVSKAYAKSLLMQERHADSVAMLERSLLLYERLENAAGSSSVKEMLVILRP